jgi:hypothetical protein
VASFVHSQWEEFWAQRDSVLDVEGTPCKTKNVGQWRASSNRNNGCVWNGSGKEWNLEWLVLLKLPEIPTERSTQVFQR